MKRSSTRAEVKVSRALYEKGETKSTAWERNDCDCIGGARNVSLGVGAQGEIVTHIGVAKLDT